MHELPIDVLVLYLARRRIDVEALRRSLREGSVAEFVRIGHQLGGNARNFGFLSLERIAHQMEDLAVQDLEARGPQLIQAFVDWLEKTLTDFEGQLYELQRLRMRGNKMYSSS